MRFQPKTEEEAKQGNVLKAGEVDFEVKTATDETSQKGNEMIHLTIEAFDADGKRGFIHDYLLDSIAHKLRHFCYSVGLGRHYEAGTLEAGHCVGKGGRAVLGIEEDKTGKFPPKNTVRDYVVAEQTKRTEGYQQGKVAHSQPGHSVESVKRMIWEKITARKPGSCREELMDELSSLVNAYSRKPKETWSIGDWEKFAADDFIKKIENPISEIPEFDETSIPF